MNTALSSTLSPINSANVAENEAAQKPSLAFKQCPKCGRMLPLSQFETHNKARDGHRRCCKECSPDTRKNTKSKSGRSVDFIPQPGNKATLTLADFTDDNLFAELRRRGYNGELHYSKVVTV